MPSSSSRIVSIVSPCYNEAESIEPLYARIAKVMAEESAYDFELILIDNCSTDGTVSAITALCRRDARVKLIVNARNFGHVRSPVHALMQARGNAAICLASDLEDPPELIPQMLRAWEGGSAVVAAVYEKSPDGWLMRFCRRFYYRVLGTVSESASIPGFTGFGLYDRRVIEILRRIGGPYPYVRGLVSELGLPIARVPFQKERRKFGFTKNSFLTLVEFALLGLTSSSRAPIRFATLLGGAMSMFGFFVAGTYLLAKLLFWSSFPLGQAPLLIGIFLFGSVQILIAGLIGEYVASLHQRAQNHPHVVELYRVNLPDDAAATDPAIGPSRPAVVGAIDEAPHA
jgi:dolichol-phosphate mannosyltransferase